MSKKVAVIYQSKTGYTEKYAKWIAEALKGDLFEGKTVDVKDLKEYHTIIYGGGIYAGKINGIDFVTKNYEELKDKQLVAFACGSGREDNARFKEMCKANFNEAQQEKIKTFYLRGGFDFSKLGFGSKILMTLFKIPLKKSDTEESREMLAAYKKPTDYTKKENTSALIQWVRSL
ncbi:MAG: flavodoxin [Cellulosilyticum sp.]|nr:flavodoxin [Cellulosilyticum sp.]